VLYWRKPWSKIQDPNPLDKMQGRGGYGIWFHGTDQPLKPRDTNGCIVLENGGIDELADYIKLHETPVIIAPRIEWVYPDSLKQECDEVEKVIDGWKEAWENKNISNYLNFYSPRFSAQGMDWYDWKAYKSRLAKKYGEIKVNIDNLHLIKANGVVLASFYQTYHTNKFESRGEKRLYLAKNSNEWKIISEFFKEVDTWKNAWEQQDLCTYISLYDQKFRSQGMDLKAWKRYKKKLNKKYRSIKIQISKLKIIRHSANSVRVRFRQSYQADTYHDLGIKNLYLKRSKEGWKIKKETWHKIAGRVSV
jgi:murein L,D-transpeptidase YafK